MPLILYMSLGGLEKKARFVVGALELEVIPSRRVSLVFLCPNSYEEFIFQSWDGSVYKANAQHNQTQLLLKNTTFATFKASQFALSPDLNYVLLGYDVQQVRGNSACRDLCKAFFRWA
ncbi:unnamed protein product [Boreogadus saida]